MSNDYNIPDSNDYNVPDSSAIVETETPYSTVQAETAALIEAIKRRAQAEVQAAENLTREAYLNAVTQARTSVEQTKLIDPDQIESSIQHLQQDAEKNWTAIAQEIQSFGDRLSEAARVAWETLTQPKQD